MNIFSSITRDHAILILLISSIVSLISSIVIAKFNTKKDRQLQAFHTKQQFYVEFVVYQIIFNNHHSNSSGEFSEEFHNKIKLLNAEMLIKADIEIIREVIKLRKMAAITDDRDKILAHVTHIINKFRRRANNKPLSLHEFKEFMEKVYLSSDDKSVSSL